MSLAFYANNHLFDDSKEDIRFRSERSKTTAMKILGLSKPTSGEVTVAGYDVYKEPNKIKNRIAI